MSGFFGCVSRKECVADVFYGTDYHSHLGTKKAGMAFYNGEDFVRSIHSIESAYFRNKFEPELGRFIGSYLGIGVISDMESQPITVTSHLGRFAVVTVGRIDNLEEISAQLLKELCRNVRVGHQPDRSSQYSDQQRRDIQGRYRERLPYGQGVLFFFNSDRQLYLCCP